MILLDVLTIKNLLFISLTGFNYTIFIIFFILFSFHSDAKSNKIIFSDGLINLSSQNKNVASGYLSILNKSKEDLVLTSILSDFSDITEIHNIVLENDVVKMVKEKRVTIKKNSVLFFQTWFLTYNV